MGPTASRRSTWPTLFTFDPGNLSLLDQLLLGVDGVDMFLEGLEDLLDGSIGGFKLPLVGDKLSGAADAIGDFRDGFVEGFRKAHGRPGQPGPGLRPSRDRSGRRRFRAAGRGSRCRRTVQVAGPRRPGRGHQHRGHRLRHQHPERVRPDNRSSSTGTSTWAAWLANAGAGIGFDLGIPGLGLETEGNIQLDVNWALDLGFGINFADGFYLDIGKQSEFELPRPVTTPGLGVTGRLGFLQIEAHENVEADEGADAEPERGNTGLTVQFGVDILNRQMRPATSGWASRNSAASASTPRSPARHWSTCKWPSSSTATWCRIRATSPASSPTSPSTGVWARSITRPRRASTSSPVCPWEPQGRLPQQRPAATSASTTSGWTSASTSAT